MPTPCPSISLFSRPASFRASSLAQAKYSSTESLASPLSTRALLTGVSPYPIIAKLFPKPKEKQHLCTLKKNFRNRSFFQIQVKCSKRRMEIVAPPKKSWVWEFKKREKEKRLDCYFANRAARALACCGGNWRNRISKRFDLPVELKQVRIGFSSIGILRRIPFPCESVL